MGTNYIAPTWRMPRNANNTPVDKLSNYSIDFDGSSQHINTDLTQSGTIAVSCWFYTDDASTQMAFFGAGTTNPYQIRNFGLQNGEYVVGCYTKDLTPNFRGIRFDTTAGSASYTTGQWTHFVGIIEQVTSTNANYYLYENGILKVQVNDGYREQTTYPFFLGSMNNFGTATQKFNGKISQLAVFDYAPSQDQVNYLYNLNNPMAISGAEPIAYWPLGDNANPIAVAGYPNISVGADSVFDFTKTTGECINLGFQSDDWWHDDTDSVVTISTWVNVEDWTDTSFRAIASKLGTSGATYQWRIATTGVNKLQFLIGGGPSGGPYSTLTQDVILTSEYTTPSWLHICWRHNPATNSSQAIFNGDVGSAVDLTNFQGKYVRSQTTIYNRIGNVTSLSQPFDGKISNLQRWNTYLSDASIQTLYNNGQPLMTGTQPEEANLRAWYKLNQSANWEADSVGNWQIPDAVSAFPQCFEFDGIADKVTIPKGSITDTGAKSVSIWIKNEITSGTDYVFNSRAGGGDTLGITLIQTTTTGYIISNSYNPSQSSHIATGYQSALNIPNDGKWHHIAWTAFPTAQRVKAYIDGVFVYEFVGDTTVDSTPSTDITVGATTSPWTGKLSNFQIWDDVVLSDGGVALNDPAGGQIAELFNNGTPLTTAIESSNMKVWCKFDSTAVWYPASGIWGFPNAVEPGSPIVNFSN